MPTQSMVHLGFGIDSRNSSFSITDKYRAKFRKCREDLLERKTACLLDLQRWVGKCNHLRLVFPANSLFTFEARCHMASLGDERLPLPASVLDEVAFWTFVDSFTEPIPFLLQQHVSLRLFTDASGFAWGASVDLPTGPLVLRDYWSSPLLCKDICAKEALAVLFCLQAIEDRLYCRRVDVYVDNEGLFHAWNGLKSKSKELVGVLQSLFLLTLDLRLSLRLHWVPTDKNPADAPSRSLSRSDCMLSPALRRKIWDAYGPFSHDLMALPSNVFRTPDGAALPFFSRFPTPSASGVDVFAQPAPRGRLYVFPPFGVITPIVRLLMEWGGVEAVLVLPEFQRVASWSQLLRPFIQDALPLFSSTASRGALLFPSSEGFSENLLPLRHGLSAYRCIFPARSLPPALALPGAGGRRLCPAPSAVSFLAPSSQGHASQPLRRLYLGCGQRGSLPRLLQLRCPAPTRRRERRLPSRHRLRRPAGLCLGLTPCAGALLGGPPFARLLCVPVSLVSHQCSRRFGQPFLPRGCFGWRLVHSVKRQHPLS